MNEHVGGGSSNDVGMFGAVSKTLEPKLERQLVDMRWDLESMDSVLRCRMLMMREDIDRSVAAAASAMATLTTTLEASKRWMTDNLSATGTRLSKHVRGMVRTVAANTPNDARIAKTATSVIVGHNESFVALVDASGSDVVKGETLTITEVIRETLVHADLTDDQLDRVRQAVASQTRELIALESQRDHKGITEDRVCALIKDAAQIPDAVAAADGHW